jgi:hypothetical protein
VEGKTIPTKGGRLDVDNSKCSSTQKEETKSRKGYGRKEKDFGCFCS